MQTPMSMNGRQAAARCMKQPHDRAAGSRSRAGASSLRLEAVENMLLYLLARASADASGPFHSALKTRGIAVIEGRILNLLATGTFTVGMLAERALSKQTTVTMALERMARQGLLKPVEDTKDRRRINLMLTAKGRRLAGQVNRLALEREQHLFAGYSKREAVALKRVLRALIARATADDRKRWDRLHRVAEIRIR